MNDQLSYLFLCICMFLGVMKYIYSSNLQAVSEVTVFSRCTLDWYCTIGKWT